MIHDNECEMYSEACGCESRQELKQRIHNAYEVYAGMEGVKRPLTDREQYLMDRIVQMARELKPPRVPQ